VPATAPAASPSTTVTVAPTQASTLPTSSAKVVPQHG
jgi:hypothetical protein